VINVRKKHNKEFSKLCFAYVITRTFGYLIIFQLVFTFLFRIKTELFIPIWS
jgi:hypothetical protein